MIHLSEEEALAGLYMSETWYRPPNLPADGSAGEKAFSRLKPRRQLLALIALTGPENKNFPRMLPWRQSINMRAIHALNWIVGQSKPSRMQDLLQDEHINGQMKAAIIAARTSGRCTGDLFPAFARQRNHKSNLRIVQYGSVEQRVDFLKSLGDAQLPCLVSSAGSELLQEAIQWARRVERRKVYAPEGATLTVVCGGEDLVLTLVLSAGQWRRVRAGEQLTIYGEGCVDVWDGDYVRRDEEDVDDREMGRVQDIWHFNFGHCGSLKVTFDNGADGFIGNIEDGFIR
jgi:hypothetical protein